MHFSEEKSRRLIRLLARSAELQATTEAKLNTLTDAYEELAAKALEAIQAIENDRTRSHHAKDFADTLDRHLCVMQEFMCPGANEPLMIAIPNADETDAAA